LFDANMRYLPANKMFFAEIHRAGPALEEKGFKAGQVVVCKMLDDSNVEAYRGSNSYRLDDRTDGYKTLLVYAGNFDLTGFIDDKVRDKAKDARIEYDAVRIRDLEKTITTLQTRISLASEYLEEENDESLYNAIEALEGQ
tara:strand:+ start:761 stop:1183 length:423 start_codon:yes stop_codon:yes gene_type:complete